MSETLKRGNFPKGPPGETLHAKRERYEQWILNTDTDQSPDYELQSIKFYRGRTITVSKGPGSSETKAVPAKASREICSKSRCWQCMGGGIDPNAQDRIAACASTNCGLWAVRPYQERDAAEELKRKRGRPADTGNVRDFKSAIRKYCGQCVGGPQYGSPWREVAECGAVTCGIWPARPGNSLSAAPAEAAEAQE